MSQTHNCLHQNVPIIVYWGALQENHIRVIKLGRLGKFEKTSREICFLILPKWPFRPAGMYLVFQRIFNISTAEQNFQILNSTLSSCFPGHRLLNKQLYIMMCRIQQYRIDEGLNEHLAYKLNLPLDVMKQYFRQHLPLLFQGKTDNAVQQKRNYNSVSEANNSYNDEYDTIT